MGRAAKCPFSCEHLVENGAESKNVTASVGIATFDLLW